MALIDRDMVMIDYLSILGTADSYKAKFEALSRAVDFALEADAVPRDFHDRCMQIEIKKRFAAEKTARQCIENYEPVKRGRWIVDERRRISDSRGASYNYTPATCSECKTEGSPMWRRCPVCEAKMYGTEPTPEGRQEGERERNDNG